MPRPSSRKFRGYDFIIEKKMVEVNDEYKYSKTADNLSHISINSMIKRQTGELSPWKFLSHVQSNFAKRQILSEISLPINTETQNRRETAVYVTSANLEKCKNRYLLCGLNTGGLGIYDTKSVKNKKFPEISVIHGSQKRAHSSQVIGVNWFPSDAGLFTSTCGNNEIRVWDPNTMKIIDKFKLSCKSQQHHMSPVASSHSLIAAAGDTGEIILCDLRSGSSSHRLFGHQSEVTCVKWSLHNQHCLASGSKDRTIRLWDVRSGKSCYKILDGDARSKSKPNSSSVGQKVPTAHRHDIISLCYSPNGLWLVSMSYKGKIKVWDAHTGQSTNLRFDGVFNDINRHIRLSISEKTFPDILYVPNRAYVMAYELTTGKLVNVMKGHFSTVLGCVFNPDNLNLYSFGKDRNFAVWVPDIRCNNEIDIEENNEDAWSSDENS